MSTTLRGLFLVAVLMMAALLQAQETAPAKHKSAAASRADRGQADLSLVPGMVIDYSPAASGQYIGSPSLTVLPDGTYVASHDFFGPKTKEHQSATTVIFRSEDRGKTWKQISRIDGAFWSNLFVHKNRLYLMGPTHHHGLIVIRRSDDGGKTWTVPRDGESGLLTEAGEYHTAPMPVVIHNGRLWRAMEDAGGGKKWGSRYRAMMLSAPVDADLLKRSSWAFSNHLTRDAKWLNGRFNAWLEGNAVVTPQGKIVNILRADQPRGGKAAMVHISPNGKTASFDPKTGFIEFPGGSKKFTIRFDPQTRLYWSLTNWVAPKHSSSTPQRTRNAVALVASKDLRKWEIRSVLLYHPDTKKHGFQYLDWQFDGNDLIAACRTAYDDGLGGAHNQHDANFLTFHRFNGFRELSMKDSVIDPKKLEISKKR